MSAFFLENKLFRIIIINENSLVHLPVPDITTMEPNTKLYYDTNEVAAMVGCEASALRFWEKKFPQLAPKRDSRNRRRYTERDIEVIRKIMHQKDKQGRTIKGAREQMRRKEESQLMIYRLTRVRDFLAELRDNL